MGNGDAAGVPVAGEADGMTGIAGGNLGEKADGGAAGNLDGGEGMTELGEEDVPLELMELDNLTINSFSACVSHKKEGII